MTQWAYKRLQEAYTIQEKANAFVKAREIEYAAVNSGCPSRESRALFELDKNQLKALPS